MNRDVVCQLPPEAGPPQYIAERLKKPAYGMNDAGATFLTKHCVAMAWFPHDPIDAVTYLILCRRVTKLGNTGYKGPLDRRTVQKTPSLNHVIDHK